jgi:putative exosortase-associated protein (TIGR04073 family)
MAEPPEPGGKPNRIEPSTTKGPYYYASENELRARKLARGVANVGLAVFELPNQMFQEAHRTSPISGAVVGLGKGVVKGAKRFAVGIWEIATFYHKGKGKYGNYKPIIKPEVVFQEYLH